MRYYLDTNMLVFILQKNKDNINRKVVEILKDYSTILYASSVAVNELIFLYRIGKVSLNCNKNEQDVICELKQTYDIETIFFNEHHFKKYLSLNIVENHKDMNDHTIIAQAVSDKIPLISSDHEFKNYESQGLEFIFNKR